MWDWKVEKRYELLVIVKVCRLRKSLYGLKTEPSSWFGKFSEALQVFGLKKSNCDHTMFYKHFEGGIILLMVYVDYIVIIGSDVCMYFGSKAFSSHNFRRCLIHPHVSTRVEGWKLVNWAKIPLIPCNENKSQDRVRQEKKASIYSHTRVSYLYKATRVKLRK